MKKAVIIPTGDEVRAGLVLDTNSPAIMGIILEKYPLMTVLRAEPAADEMGEIRKAILSHRDSDLIIVIGGSGGGKKYDASLARDVTHTVLENILADHQIKEIYGYNGHLWSRLIIGRLGNAIVANVPGPLVEAVAAAKAIVQGLSAGNDLCTISDQAAQAVMEQYPMGGKLL